MKVCFAQKDQKKLKTSRKNKSKHQQADKEGFGDFSNCNQQ